MAALNDPLLHRYWIAFAIAPPRGPEGYVPAGPLYRCCGVTAYTLDDALYLIREQLTLGRDLPAIDHVIEDIDVATLDAGHIRPNNGRTVLAQRLVALHRRARLPATARP